jgi:hypothetical protein
MIPEVENILTREIQETFLATLEDVLEVPAAILTPPRIKITATGDGAIITLLAFEAKIDV